jgi:PIN domain nuclease of toxin-antitoxin system
MIVLDTHIWVWWVDGSTRLTPGQVQHLRTYEAAGLGVSVISCWEVAKLVEVGRLALSCPVKDWVEQALTYPGIY